MDGYNPVTERVKTCGYDFWTNIVERRGSNWLRGCSGPEGWVGTLITQFKKIVRRPYILTKEPLSRLD
jgi:hypothetical protein